MLKTLAFALLAASASLCAAQAAPSASVSPTAASTTSTGRPHIAKGSRLFIEPMDGFETTLAAAMLKKNVPVVIVDDKSKADFILSGTSDTEKAGWAKTIFFSPNSHSQASILVKDQSGSLAFAYNVDKIAARKGSQSTAEACAKHLKEAIDKK